MTKKDFELIARVLRTARSDTPDATGRRVTAELAAAFADELAATNPRFDRARFIAAATKD